MSSLRLLILLRDMDIPQMRRDVSKPENVRWLMRNLHIRNLDHPSVFEALAILGKMVKEQ